MFTYVYDDEDEDVPYSVAWVRSYLESNLVWLFNAEFLAKISNDAELLSKIVKATEDHEVFTCR